MKERFIKISKNKIYVTNDDFIELSQTNFPENSLSFKYHLDIYLKVEISNFNNHLKSLDIEIIDYTPLNIHDFNNQELKRKIERIEFKELEWEELKRLLSSYQNNLPTLIPNAFKKVQYLEEDFFENEDIEEVNLIKNNEVGISTILNEEEIEILEFEFSEYFENSTFHLGYISLRKQFEGLNYPLEIKIYNENILPEYEYIKSYFSKYFNNGLFKVFTKLELKKQEVLNIASISKEIEKINYEVIGSIKKQRILNVVNLVGNVENKKHTFTLDEILSKVDNSEVILQQSEEEVINLILELKNPRNKRQLIYLASKKHNSIEKIRFTLKPRFGFMFYITGRENVHICWELLNSHATYLWSFNKTESIKFIIEQSETNISTIKEIGRKKYRRQVKMDVFKANFKFNIINHSKSKLSDNFDNWEKKLLSKLK